MKYLFLSSILFSMACGSSGNSGGSNPQPNTACSSSVFEGSWTGTVNGLSDTLTFGPSCVYKDSQCQGTGTYPDATALSGTILITITSTVGGAGCLPVGQTPCTYAINGGTATYTCGGGQIILTKN